VVARGVRQHQQPGLPCQLKALGGVRLAQGLHTPSTHPVSLQDTQTQTAIRCFIQQQQSQHGPPGMRLAFACNHLAAQPGSMAPPKPHTGA